MSEMQVAYGIFKKSSLNIDPDADDFYELEEEHGCHYVNVDGQLYSFFCLADIDAHGFSLLIPPSDQTRFMCLWYNGGAGIHEVVEEVIRKSLKDKATEQDPVKQYLTEMSERGDEQARNLLATLPE